MHDREHSHSSENAFWQIIHPRKEEECREQYNSRTDKRRHLGTSSHITIDTRTSDGAESGERSRDKCTGNVGRAQSYQLPIWTNRVAEAGCVLFSRDNAIQEACDRDDTDGTS